MSNEVPDYTDRFAVASALRRSAEEWARAAFEEAPRPLRWLMVVGWQLALGLRLGPRPSSHHVLGWQIVDRAPDAVTVQARSWLLAARLRFSVDGSSVSQSTFVRYEHRLAAVIWPPVSLLHRRIVPYNLRRAVARASADSSGW